MDGWIGRITVGGGDAPIVETWAAWLPDEAEAAAAMARKAEFAQGPAMDLRGASARELAEAGLAGPGEVRLLRR